MISPIELRHLLHQNPELAFQEYKTTETIIKAINSIPDHTKKIIIHTPMKTGLLVEYKINEGNYILFRADIDALPIKEETSYKYRSVNNFMHACGHDVHTSILFGLLDYISRAKINQNLLFLFQPAEESGGGAMKFFETGIFSLFKIDKAFALHVSDEYSIGTVASTKGVLFASALEVNVNFFGKSAHIAFPADGKNAFNALRLFLDSVDKLPRELYEPFLLAFGKITSGSVRNIIPDQAVLEGTIRALIMNKTNVLFSALENIAMTIERITDVKINVSKGAHYPEVNINEILFEEISKRLSGKFNFLDCGYKMTGEDFGYISHQFPSFMFWLGTSKGEYHGLHNPIF
jgi:N-acetyldiaminopimelate deacetylase